MTDRSKGFDRRFMLPDRALAFDHGLGAQRREAEVGRIAGIKASACPPDAMHAAPMAPARGPQVMVPNFSVTGGGMRRVEGGHWVGLSPLASAVAQARLRHEARGSDAPFAAPFTPGQIAVAEDYAALVQWREGSGMKCASLEAGRGGSGSGMFIDTFIDQGQWLAQLRARIGDGVAMSVRRHMDRGNARRTITVRAGVDMLCLGGIPVKTILRRFGWVADMKDQKALRLAICGALDRMQGYRDA